ncbi:predicted protein [Nematostella vectensis]|uniref:Uncharacterized protein n=1 Tax=Nematostella vectensis TaxID=45351 RepID=A7T0D1_NEMVE|nr:uncharacterized protein LOC5501387 [Nematostella vectensis]EDO30589.1 predicted protein [Nematostella vectensis]|eukprot:XP_001622689.1 predicted protein [Nematostella vectensis]
MTYSFNTPAKVIGVLHATFGGLLVLFGIVVRLQVHHWSSIILVGIWTGGLMMFTGAVAIIGSHRQMDMPPKRCFVLWFVILSLLCIALASAVIVCYAMAIMAFYDIENVGSFPWWSYTTNDFKQQNKNRSRVLCIIMLVLGCLEFINAVISLIHGLGSCCMKTWHKPKHEQMYDARDMPMSYVNEAAAR